MQYDVAIIGSGLGGLVCGALLSRNGYRVAIFEKNKQIGGCLQTYARDTGALVTALTAPIYVKGERWGAVQMGWNA